MRRFFQLCGILLLAFIIFSISADTYPDSMQVPERSDVEPTPILTPAIQVEDRPYHAVIQYGNPEVIKDNSGPLYTYIRFPQSGGPTDDVISNWARNLHFGVQTEFIAMQENEPGAIGEINVHFDSYLVDYRYAGIFQEGEFSYTLDPLIPPEEVIKTFNIDLLHNTFLESRDILDYSKMDEIIEILRERLIVEYPGIERHLGFVDETWFNILVISDIGIIVVLDKFNNLLPEMYGTITATLPYEVLDDVLLIRKDPPLTPPPASEPLPDHSDTVDTYDDPEDTDDTDDPEDIDDTEPSVSPQSNNIDRSMPIIALTLDDGPGVYTNQFLDLFEKYNIRVTFSTIGNLVNTQEEALIRAIDLGHEVIGHSWDHKNLAKLPADAVSKQITDTSNIIEEVTGTNVKLFRPPYGAVSDTMREVSRDLGFSMIYWTLDPRDWDTKDPETIYHYVLNNIEDGSIILSHETYRTTLLAYQNIIPELLLRGYQFVTISELISLKSVEMEPGDVYPMMR